MNSKNVENMQ